MSNLLRTTVSLFLMLSLAACTAESVSQTDGEVGVVNLPLQTTTTTGEVYELVGDIELSGPIVTTLSATGSETVLSAVVPPGTYDVTLLPGWTLSRVDNGTPVTVAASLVSPNPTQITTGPASTITVNLEFAVGSAIIAFTGDSELNVSIAVHDSPVSSLATAQGLCGAGTICMGGTMGFDQVDSPTALLGATAPFAISFDENSRSPFGPESAQIYSGPADFNIDLSATTADVNDQAFFADFEASMDGGPVDINVERFSYSPTVARIHGYSMDGRFNFDGEFYVPLASAYDGSPALATSTGDLGPLTICDNMVPTCYSYQGFTPQGAFVLVN